VKSSRIIRADTLRIDPNGEKVAKVLAFIRAYRKLAVCLGREQWRLVFETGKAAAFHPGNKTLNLFCGAAPVQMARPQVSEQISGWLSNRGNEFSSAVQTSTLPLLTKHQLHVLNRANAIYRPGLFTMRDGTVITPETRRLARSIMRGIMAKHRKPNLRNISPRLDVRVAQLQKAETAHHADFWLKLKFVGQKAAFLPVHDHPYRALRAAPLCRAVQLVTDANGLGLRVFSDVTESFAQNRAAYQPRTDVLCMDFGLRTLFATDEGDLLGRDWLTHLRRYDAKLQSIARHMQRIGRKPRDSKRFRAIVQDVRGFVKTEVNGIINRLIERRKPAHLVLEKLNFRNRTLSRRLNRILGNCGRTIIKAKCVDLEQRLGVTSEEINPAWTSLECEICHYVSKDNRNGDKFACLCCGHEAHADVHAARKFRSRRSGQPGAVTARTKMGALAELSQRFGEWLKTQADGVRNSSVRRGDLLKRSAFVRLKSDQIAWTQFAIEEQ
jgi:putative transposase